MFYQSMIYVLTNGNILIPISLYFYWNYNLIVSPDMLLRLFLLIESLWCSDSLWIYNVSLVNQHYLWFPLKFLREICFCNLKSNFSFIGLMHKLHFYWWSTSINRRISQYDVLWSVDLCKVHKLESDKIFVPLCWLLMV